MVRLRASERIEFIDPSGDSTRVLFDLSKGGACCLLKRKFEKGAYILVSLDQLKIRARITYTIERTDGYRTGLQFWNLSPAQQKDLDAMVDRFSRGVPVACTVLEEGGSAPDAQGSG